MTFFDDMDEHTSSSKNNAESKEEDDGEDKQIETFIKELIMLLKATDQDVAGVKQLAFDVVTEALENKKKLLLEKLEVLFAGIQEKLKEA